MKVHREMAGKLMLNWTRGLHKIAWCAPSTHLARKMGWGRKDYLYDYLYGLGLVGLMKVSKEVGGEWSSPWGSKLLCALLALLAPEHAASRENRESKAFRYGSGCISLMKLSRYVRRECKYCTFLVKTICKSGMVMWALSTPQAGWGTFLIVRSQLGLWNMLQTNHC